MASGATAVIVFDGAASLASRQFGFKYSYAAYGSYLLYAAVGFLTARIGSVAGAAAAGAVIGIVDATIGWAVSWAIGPGRTPDETLSAQQWITAALSLRSLPPFVRRSAASSVARL